jgi:hypothetical protein
MHGRAITFRAILSVNGEGNDERDHRGHFYLCALKPANVSFLQFSRLAMSESRHFPGEVFSYTRSVSGDRAKTPRRKKTVLFFYSFCFDHWVRCLTPGAGGYASSDRGWTSLLQWTGL